ncbi:Antiviral helicase SKI2 [Bienertia sinuspersici]
MESVSLRFYHGGGFKKFKNGLLYVGGQIKTVEVDPDQLCGFWLKELAGKCGSEREIEQVMYLVPGLLFEDGLRTVFDDKEVREMAEVASKQRGVDLYVVHVGDEVFGKGISQPSHTPSNVSPLPKVNRPKKLTPKRAPTGATRRCPRQVDSPAQKEPATGQSTLTLNDALNVDPINPNISTQPPSLNNDNDKVEPQTSFLPQTNTETAYTSAEKTPPFTEQTQLNPSFIRTSVPDDYQWEDIRPDSPLGWADLLRTDFSSDVDDSESDYEGDYEDESDDSLSSFVEEGFLSDEGVLSDEVFQDEDEEQQTGEEVVGEEFVGDIDTSDEETRIARDRVKGHNKELIQLARQLEQEAGEGSLGLEQQQKVDALSGQLDAGEQGPLSDYEGSDQDIHTPPETDDEESLRQSREERSSLVSENSDWASFKWRAGQRFPTRELFKKAVAKFAIIQGRNLSIVVSNKKRNQRIGVKCIGDCPFRLYSSWDSRRAIFVVKTVMDEHTCCRNMEKNKQLKSTWCAEQLLEVFKAKPHWPAKDIIETIRRAYKVVVKKDFAYKIKHYAHRMLHGSMKDHYKKVGRAHMSATTKADVITNNMAETFNAYIIQARSKHLLYMLEDIRASLMQRLIQKRKEMEKVTSTICPRIQQKLEKEKDEACILRFNSTTGGGRPRKAGATTAHNSDTTTAHHAATAEPTRIGRGGRVIRGGRGSRGGRGGRSARGGRGGRSGMPFGIGVLMGADGSAYTNVPGSSIGPRQITSSVVSSSFAQNLSQASTSGPAAM